MAVADGTYRRASVPEPLLEEAPHLVDEPLSPHLFDPGIDAFVQQLPLEVESELLHVLEFVGPFGKVGFVPASEFLHFEGTDSASAIARLDLCRGFRSDAVQMAVEFVGADPFEFCFPLGPHLLVGGRKFEDVGDRAGVQGRASNEDGHSFALSNVRDRCPGQLLELCDGGVLCDVEDVDEVVRDLITLLSRGFRCPDVHASVDEHRITVDDFRFVPVRAQTPCKIDGQSRFAGGSRADDHDQRRKHVLKFSRSLTRSPEGVTPSHCRLGRARCQDHEREQSWACSTT